MIVSSVNNYNIIGFPPARKRNQRPFKGNISIPENTIFRLGENVIDYFAILKRMAYNYRVFRKNKENITAFYNKIMNVPTESSDFMKFFHNYARKFGKNREVEINLESNRLLDIAKSDEACIFIMSHSDTKRDPAMMGIFGTLLSGAYINLGKSATCPRPKIIVNKEILTSMNKFQRGIYEKFGAVGINANLFSAGKGKNSETIHELINNFVQDKNHIFIFPEGKMSMFKDLELKNRFQPGIGGIIRSALKSKKQVKVVPLGFAYNNKTQNFLGSLYIGEPVYFKKNGGGEILVNQANIDINIAKGNYKKFWSENKQDAFKVITSNSEPVTGYEQGLYIAGLLCENLRICTEKAKIQLPEDSLSINKVIKI